MGNVSLHIKLFRKKKGMTQDELAERLFVSRQTVSNYENGKSHPDIDMLIKIANILETDVNSLIYGDEAYYDKKGRMIRWCLRSVFIILICLLLALLEKEAQTYLKIYYDNRLYVVIYALLLPILCFVIGAHLAEVVFCFFPIQPSKLKEKPRKYMLCIIIGIAVLLLIISLILWKIFFVRNFFLLPIFALLGVLMRTFQSR